DDELLTFRKFGSRLEGHPTPKIPWVDVATGSLGQGLPISVGVALAGKKLDRLPYRVWCLCGDGERAGGAMGGGGGVRLGRDRDRRSRRGSDRPRVRGGARDNGTADGDHRAHDQGQGREGRGEQGRLARQS